MKKIILAIDGYSGCGKSSTAKRVAAALNYAYLDTGAMYRAVTLFFLENQVDFSDKQNIKKILEEIRIYFAYNEDRQRNETYLNEVNVEDEIRKMYVAQKVSQVSEISEVRRFLVAQQQALGKEKGIVAEGRDIGTVVFPKAELKIFMKAETQVRAARRQAELKQKGQEVSLEEIIENLKKRDYIDSNRADSPLQQAQDAVVLDTTHLNFEEQVQQIVTLAEQKITSQQ